MSFDGRGNQVGEADASLELDWQRPSGEINLRGNWIGRLGSVDPASWI